MGINKVLFLSGVLLVSACSKNSTENNFLGNTFQNQQDKNTKININGDVELSSTQLNLDSKFFIHKGKQPSRNSVEYFSEVEKKINQNERMLVVDGIVIKIANGSQTDIKRNQNLNLVEINAEVLIIERPLHFPGAKVVINARSLVFNGNGSLSVKPNKILAVAEFTKDGRKGQSAGSITLNVDQLDLGERKVRFDLSGGDGQDAGLGIAGKAGKSVADFGDGVIRTCVTTITTCHEKELGEVEISKVGPICNSNQVPTNGEKGTLAGSPGAGGDGGELLVKEENIVSRDYIKLENGISGLVADKTKGGIAGSPKVFIANYINESKSKGFCGHGGGGRGGLGPKNYAGFVGKMKIGETFDGEDLDSPAEPKEKGMLGKVKVLPELKFNPSSKLLNHRLLFAKDLYRNNYFSEALIELQEIDKDSSANLDALSMLVNKDARQLINQLNSHKDIDGLAINHVPDLSLPKIISAYNKEIEISFNTLQFTSRFLRNVYSVKEKSEKLQEKKNSLSDEVIEVHVQNRKAHEALADIMRLSSEVESKKISFDEALKKLEIEIENEAKRNIHSKEKKRKLLGAVKLVSNLAKVFPAGQPAVGAIGTGIETIVAMSEEEDGNWQDRLEQGYELYSGLRKSLNSENWRKSKEDWNANYRQLYYEKFKESNPDLKGKKFEKYLKETIEKTKPMYGEINKYYKDIYSKQVPKSEYEAEIQKIKAQHSGFNYVLAKLEELQIKKVELDNGLNKNMAIINSTETEIYNLLMAMEAADFERGELLDGLNFDVEDSIKIINDRAKKRLQDYKRRLIKAYNYRLLIPYSGSYELEKLEEQFKEFSRSNGETIDIKLVKDLYYEDLNQIADGILQSLDTGAVREYETSVSYELNINELAALNSGKGIYFNPKLKGLIQDDEENQRVESIAVDYIDSILLDDRKILDVSIDQVGKVEIERNGNVYVFSPSENRVQWKSRFDPMTNDLSIITESDSLGTLFDVLFPNGSANTELYAKPGLRSNYLIKVSNNLKELKGLRVLIKYTYSVKK